jgi:DNA-binding PadR family transcriptional regulator
MRGYRAEKRRKALRGTWNDVILDYLETWGAMSPLDLVRLISERHPDVNHNTVVKAVKRLEDRGLLDADRYAPNDVVYRVSDWYLENVG